MIEALRSYLLSWYFLLVLLVVCGLYVPLQRLRLNRDIARLGGRAPPVTSGFLGLCEEFFILMTVLTLSRSCFYMGCCEVFPGLHCTRFLALVVRA
jgi:hypothetical protein